MSEMTFGLIFIGMNYLIYKITNRLDNKFYVGKHKTENQNDNYFGSGLLLERAVEKHGKENFVKEILFFCKTEEEMNQKEADIVDEEFVSRSDTYNIKLGGIGGFDYINKNGLSHSVEWRKSCKPSKQGKPGQQEFRKLFNTDKKFREEYKEKLSNSLKLYNFVNGSHWRGKNHSEETKKKMSEAKKGKVNGKKNPAFGKHWITNGTESKLVKKEDVPNGWRKGRV